MLYAFLMSVACSDKIDNADYGNLIPFGKDEIDEIVKYPKDPANTRILSYNIKHAEGMDNVINYQRIADMINELGADIVCLQEVDSVMERSNKVDQAKKLGELTDMHAFFSKSINSGGGKYGNALLTKQKPIKYSTIPLPGAEKRSALIVEFETIVAISTHFTHIGNEENLRIESIRLLTEEARKYDKVVYLCGDLNQHYNTSSEFIKEILKNWNVASSTKATAPTSNPTQCIDFILTLKDKESVPVQSHVLYQLGRLNMQMMSDHYPVFCDFATILPEVQFPKQPGHIRIITQHSSALAGKDKVMDYDRIATVYNKLNADIICFQGVDSVTERSAQLYQMGEVGDRTGMFPYFSEAIPYKGGKYGVGMVTKEKPIQEYRHALPGNEARTVLILEFPKFVVMTTQMDANAAKRVEAVGIITTLAKGFSKPVFLTGYLNEDEKGALLTTVMVNDWQIVSALKPTATSPNPTRILSFILSLKDNLKQAENTDVVYSLKDADVPNLGDHFPIFCDFDGIK